MTQWILQSVIPRPGFARDFRMLTEAMLRNPDKMSDYQKKIEKIIYTPKTFKPDFKKSDGILDVEKVISSTILPAELRARATVEQISVEAIDYGFKINRFVRTFQGVGKSYEAEREINYLRNVASWLTTWGKRGFGYTAVQS